MDLVFAALSDPTRRDILQALREKARTVGELARPFDMSLAAVSKHLNVLNAAKLIVRTKRGRETICSLNDEAMQTAEQWLHNYNRFWTMQLDSLERQLTQPRKGKN
jgi:DNA-binding transcriptional ArsR family regulator